MLVVEPRSDGGGDEELGAVGVGARVGHREYPRLGVLQREVLIYVHTHVRFGARATISQRGCERTCKRFAVDRFTTRAITVGKVASLNHEIGNDTVERGSRVTKAVFTSGELTEVPGRLWHDVVTERNHDAANGCAIG